MVCIIFELSRIYVLCILCINIAFYAIIIWSLILLGIIICCICYCVTVAKRKRKNDENVGHIAAEIERNDNQNDELAEPFTPKKLELQSVPTQSVDNFGFDMEMPTNGNTNTVGGTGNILDGEIDEDNNDNDNIIMGTGNTLNNIDGEILNGENISYDIKTQNDLLSKELENTKKKMKQMQNTINMLVTDNMPPPPPSLSSSCNISDNPRVCVC